MRQLTTVWMLLVLFSACSADEPNSQSSSDSRVESTSQFLGSCLQNCASPLACICGACTAPCDSDEACSIYSGVATCVAPPSDSPCESKEPSCDVPCRHDTPCESLGSDFVCLVGHCRQQPPYSETDDDGGIVGGGLPVCKMGAPPVGLCLLSADGAGALSNEGAALEGKITSLDAQVHPKCFGTENFGASIPALAQPEGPSVIPAGTSWWQVEAQGASYTLALAAPGLSALDVKVGDSVSLRNSVNWAGKDWLFGNATVEIAGRGEVLIAINDSTELAVSDGPVVCELPGTCGGEQWSMQISVDGSSIAVPPFESVVVGGATFTNAGGLTHRPEYMEPDESTPGTPGCRGEPRTNFVAARVTPQ